MIQSFLMLLAPGNAPQATPTSPPAAASPAKPLVPCRKKQEQSALGFGVSVLGNTMGCGAIFAACWFSIQLMQAFMTPL